MSPAVRKHRLGRAACVVWLVLCGCQADTNAPDASAPLDAQVPSSPPDAQPDSAAPGYDAATVVDAEPFLAGDAATDAGSDLPSAHDGGSSADADVASDGGYRAACAVSADKLTCEHTITDVAFAGGSRKVYWAAPIGAPPAAGFPLALIFQGSFFGPSVTWGTLTPDLPFGGFNQGLLHVKLLEAGFVVVEPEAEGGIAWQTNSGGNYDTSTDHALMLELFRRFSDTRDFGPVDDTRLYATGISSGGYMTSRMAVSHPGKMRALAIQSGSYATCLGPLCTVPDALPADHPATLFLHGDTDLTVGIDTARAYYQALMRQGVETKMIVGKGIGHAWLDSAPTDVTAWFIAHPR